jgi:cell division protein YceG involved in septum cleavage
MRLIFFLLIIGIVYYFVKYIFKGLFFSAKRPPVQSKGEEHHINIKKEDIVEAEFEEIEEKDSAE